MAVSVDSLLRDRTVRMVLALILICGLLVMLTANALILYTYALALSPENTVDWMGGRTIAVAAGLKGAGAAIVPAILQVLTAAVSVVCFARGGVRLSRLGQVALVLDLLIIIVAGGATLVDPNTTYVVDHFPNRDALAVFASVAKGTTNAALTYFGLLTGIAIVGYADSTTDTGKEAKKKEAEKREEKKTEAEKKQEEAAAEVEEEDVQIADAEGEPDAGITDAEGEPDAGITDADGEVDAPATAADVETEDPSGIATETQPDPPKKGTGKARAKGKATAADVQKGAKVA